MEKTLFSLMKSTLPDSTWMAIKVIRCSAIERVEISIKRRKAAVVAIISGLDFWEMKVYNYCRFRTMHFISAQNAYKPTCSIFLPLRLSVAFSTYIKPKIWMCEGWSWKLYWLWTFDAVCVCICESGLTCCGAPMLLHLTNNSILAGPFACSHCLNTAST